MWRSSRQASIETVSIGSMPSSAATDVENESLFALYRFARADCRFGARDDREVRCVVVVRIVVEKKQGDMVASMLSVQSGGSKIAC